MKGKVLYFFVTSALYGALSFIDIKIAVFVYIILISFALLFEKYDNIIFIFLLLSLFLIPLWVNSYGLFGISLGIIKINYPLIGLILFSIAIVKRGYIKKIGSNVDIVVFLFFIYLLISILTNHTSETLASSYVVIFPFLFYFLFAFLRSIYNINDIFYLLKISLIALIVEGLLFIIMYILQVSPFAEPLELYGRTTEYISLKVFQPVGASGPVVMGYFFIIGILISYMLYKTTSRNLYLFGSYFFIIPLFATVTRFPLFIGISCLIIITFKAIKSRRAIIALIIFLFGFLIFSFIGLLDVLSKGIYERGKETDILIEFEQRWYVAVSRVSDYLLSNYKNLLFGAGYQLFRELPYGLAAHNLFIAQAADFGLVGLLLMIFLFYSMIRYIKTYKCPSMFQKNLGRIIIYSIIIWIINGSVQYAAYSFQFYTFIFLLFNFFVSLRK